MTRPDLRLLLAATAAFAIAAPAGAQMNHANMPGMTMPTKKPAVKKPAPKKPVAKKPVAKKTVAKKPVTKKSPAENRPVAPPATDPHAGHDMSTMPGTTMAPDPNMSATPGTEMPAGHDMSAMPGNESSGTNLPAGNAPPPPVPTDHAADQVFGPAEMAMGRHHLVNGHGGQKSSRVLLNVAEYQIRNGRDGFEWDGEGWYGGDIDRLWIKTSGEGEVGSPIERAEVQALYSRAIGPYFNLQGGLRYDIRPNPSRVHAVVAFEGLAPSYFDVEGALFLSNKGELTARIEGYYDQRITQRLILQPRAELNFAAQNSRQLGIGSGLSNAEFGLRLRYDIRREFAPYVGVQYRQAFGKTRRYLRDEGEDAGGWSLLTGVRVWF